MGYYQKKLDDCYLAVKFQDALLSAIAEDKKIDLLKIVEDYNLAEAVLQAHTSDLPTMIRVYSKKYELETNIFKLNNINDLIVEVLQCMLLEALSAYKF